MTPPIEYFERCNADSSGAQRVGMDCWKFIHPDALSMMLNDGVFQESAGNDPECSECANKDAEIQTLEENLGMAEDYLSEANRTISRLEGEIELLKRNKR